MDRAQGWSLQDVPRRTAAAVANVDDQPEPSVVAGADVNDTQVGAMEQRGSKWRPSWRRFGFQAGPAAGEPAPDAFAEAQPAIQVGIAADAALVHAADTADTLLSWQANVGMHWGQQSSIWHRRVEK